MSSSTSISLSTFINGISHSSIKSKTFLPQAKLVAGSLLSVFDGNLNFSILKW